MDTALIIPARGLARRMKPPVPKPLLTAAPHMLLIDFVLKAAAVAGIETVYVVVPYEDVKTYAQVIGHSKYGLQMLFTVPKDEDADVDAGSAHRGCRRALLSGEFSKFIVAPCDAYIQENELEVLMACSDPAVLLDQSGAPKVSYFDKEVLKRLGRRLTSTPKSDIQLNGQGLWERILQEDINRSTVWTKLPLADTFVDVDTWDDLKKVWMM